MERVLEAVTSINSAINNVVWGPVMLVLLVGTGAYLTIRTGCIQATRFGYILRKTVGSLFKKSDKDGRDSKNLTAFQAVSTALASTVGTGNIAGITTAVTLGDVGGVTPPPAPTPSAAPSVAPLPSSEPAPTDAQPSEAPDDGGSEGGGQEVNLDDFLYDWLDFSGYPLTPDELIEYFGEPQDRVAVDSTLDYSTCGLPGYEDAGTVQTEILSYSNVLFMFFVDPFDGNWTVQLVAVTDPTSIIKVGGATVGMTLDECKQVLSSNGYTFDSSIVSEPNYYYFTYTDEYNWPCLVEIELDAATGKALYVRGIWGAMAQIVIDTYKGA